MKTKENVKFPERLYDSDDRWLYDARTHEKVGEVYSGDLREELARRWNAYNKMNEALKKIAGLGIHSRPLTFDEIHGAIRTAIDAAEWEGK